MPRTGPPSGSAHDASVLVKHAGATDIPFTRLPGHPAVWRYAFALVAVAAAVALKVSLSPLLEGRVFLLLLPAVIVTARYAGFGPALVASVLAVVAADFFLLDSSGFLRFDSPDAAELVVLFLVSLLVSSTTEAMRRSRLNAESMAVRIASLQQATASLALPISRDEVLDAVVEQTIDATGADVAGVLEQSDDRRDLILLRHKGLVDAVARQYARFPADVSLPVGEAVRSGEPVLLGSVAEWNHSYSIPPTVAGQPATDGAWAALPLLGARGQSIGVLALGFDRARRFSPEDREYLMALAQQCAHALDRARLYDKAQESAERLRAVLDTAADSIIVIDRTGEILQVNPATVAMFGYERSELIGRSIEILMPESHAAGHAGYIRRYLETGEARFIGKGREVAGRRKDGSEFPIDLSVSEMPLQGRLLFTGIIRDATARHEADAAIIEAKRNLERINEELTAAVTQLRGRTEDAEAARREAEKANRSKTQFVGMITHDLQTPLSSILGYADLLLLDTKGRLTEGQREQVERIRVNAERQVELIGQLLEYARLETGSAEVRLAAADLGDILRDVIEMTRSANQTTGIDIDLALPEDSRRLEIVTDPAKLGQVLQNLIGNAVKFTREGTVRVSVRPEGPALSIQVSDTGSGIPVEEQAHIFTPFHQGSGLAVSPHRRGAGLGLAIVKSLTELLGGSVDVESEVGRGSTFTLRIPRALNEPFASGAPIRKASVSPPA